MKWLCFNSEGTFGYSWCNEDIQCTEPTSINFEELSHFFIANKVNGGIWNWHQGGWQSFKEWSESFLLLWKKYLSDHLPHDFHGFWSIVLSVFRMKILNHYSGTDYPNGVGNDITYGPSHSWRHEMLQVLVVSFVLEYSLWILVNGKEQRMKCRYGDHVCPISYFY